MHNIDVNGSLVIGGYGKTLADMRRFVQIVDEYRLPDSTPCNAALFCRVDVAMAKPLYEVGILGAQVVFSKPGEAGR